MKSKKICPACGKNEIKPTQRMGSMGNYYDYYPNLCKACSKEFKGKEKPDYLEKEIKKNNSSFRHAQYMEKGVNFVEIIHEGEETESPSIDIENIPMRSISVEEIVDNNQELEALHFIVGQPGIWDWNDPTTGILYQFSTGNTLTDFQNLTMEILGSSTSEQAAKERFILHATYLSDEKRTQEELG